MPLLNLENRKILVVEDDEMNFIYLTQIFKFTNAIITRAKSGNEAIQSCLFNPKFDLILMDIKLPDIDGTEVTKKIREKLPHIPIIAQTASKNDNERDLIFNAGCTDMLIKPFKMEKLFEVITKYLF